MLLSSFSSGSSRKTSVFGISVLFVFFPSGLVLYSVANSGVQLIQQTMLYRELGALEDK